MSDMQKSRTHRLAMMLIAYEQKHDLSGRQIAAEIGIDKSGYTRIKQGKMPDARNFAKIINWMMD